MFDRLSKFLKEVRIELTKVTWPTAAELRATTMVVILRTNSHTRSTARPNTPRKVGM